MTRYALSHSAGTASVLGYGVFVIWGGEAGPAHTHTHTERERERETLYSSPLYSNFGLRRLLLLHHYGHVFVQENIPPRVLPSFGIRRRHGRGSGALTRRWIFTSLPTTARHLERERERPNRQQDEFLLHSAASRNPWLSNRISML